MRGMLPRVTPMVTMSESRVKMMILSFSLRLLCSTRKTRKKERESKRKLKKLRKRE